MFVGNLASKSLGVSVAWARRGRTEHTHEGALAPLLLCVRGPATHTHARLAGVYLTLGAGFQEMVIVRHSGEDVGE